MAEKPAGKKLTLGKDVTENDLKKFFAQKSKKVAAMKPTERKLGPGVKIPMVFLKAQQILLEKLITKNAGKKKKGKGVGRENIIGLHIGQKLVDGEPTGSLAVVVTVRKKITDRKRVQASYRIPKRVKVETKDGNVFVPVDIKIGSDVEPHAIGGDICSLLGVGGGSIGCFVFVNLGGNHTDFLLTNNHVIGRFANGNPGGDISTDDVFDSANNLIAGDPLRCGTLDGSDGLSIDAAMAFTGGRNPEADSKRHVIPTFSGTIQAAAEGDIVIMHGAATGHQTRGRVRRVLAFKDVPYTRYPIGRNIFIKSVFEIQPLDGDPTFSKPGDSGSLIVIEGNSAPTGLLIGGGDDSEGPFSLAADLAAIQADLHFTGVHSVP